MQAAGGGHGLHRPALQRELRQQRQGQDARGKDRAILNDNLGDGFYDFLLAPDAHRGALPGGIYVAMSSSELDVLLQAAFRLPPVANGRPSSSGPRTPSRWGAPTTSASTDRSCTAGPGATRHWCGDRDQGDVWNIKKPQKNDLHPTMKPVELVERAIRNSSRPATWCSILRRLWHDADRSGKVRARRAADRTRSGSTWM